METPASVPESTPTTPGEGSDENDQSLVPNPNNSISSALAGSKTKPRFDVSFGEGTISILVVTFLLCLLLFVWVGGLRKRVRGIQG